MFCEYRQSGRSGPSKLILGDRLLFNIQYHTAQCGYCKMFEGNWKHTWHVFCNPTTHVVFRHSYVQHSPFSYWSLVCKKQDARLLIASVLSRRLYNSSAQKPRQLFEKYEMLNNCNRLPCQCTNNLQTFVRYHRQRWNEHFHLSIHRRASTITWTQ